MKAKGKRTKKIILILPVSLLFAVVLACVLGAVYYSAVTNEVSLDISALKAPHAKSVIYSADGEALPYRALNSEFTNYSEISENVINAFVALEDKRFYKHGGVDYIRICGAVVSNIKSGYTREGASTITQQLVKNVYLSQEKTYERKLKEHKLAKLVEKNLTKNEIITLYLNVIYFGGGIYGITDASQKIFDKKPIDLSVAESAILAGTVKNPSRYSPIVNPENSGERMNTVLKIMLKNKAISEKEYGEAIKYVYSKPSKINEATAKETYALSALEEASQILKISEKTAVALGLNIYTFQDKKLQKHMNLAYESGKFTAGSAEYLSMVTDNKSGGVLALSASFSGSIKNIRRSPASAIKPQAVYAPALDLGYVSPATKVLDERVNIGGYSPKNYGGVYRGVTDIRGAIINSSNAVAVRLLDEVGVDYCKYIAEKMGLSFQDGDGLSLALGGMSKGVTFKEITESYMCIANLGIYKEARFVEKITDSNGKVLYKHSDYLEKHLVAKSAVSQETAYLLTDMLTDTVKKGTAKKLNSLPYPIAGKTGTSGYDNSEQNSDAWCLSYTADSTVCVWFGNLSGKKDTRLEKSVTGGAHPASMSKYLYEGMKTPKPFKIPYGIIELEIDSYASDAENKLLLANRHTPQHFRKYEIFNAKFAPKEYSEHFEPQPFDYEIPFDFFYFKRGSNRGFSLG
ncbi:MAG: transglycosylase domain-containing protein [Firmicutes bacterium]|nr:transglycosylase domain-containing protein [Bacillota bacterium]